MSTFSPSSLFSSMAETLNETHQTNPINSCFLGCFGFSMKKKPLQKPIQKKSTRSLFQPMFCLSSRKSSTETVPVDNTYKVEADHSKRKTSKQMKKNPDKPSRQNSKADQRLGSTNQVARETPKETRSSQGSSKPKKTQTKLSHTVSLPVLEGSQRVGNSRIYTPVNSKDLSLKNNELVEKFNPMKGMSIILVTLIIMLLWGRLCAILCTSAWLYFCPRFRTRSDNNESTVESSGNTNDLYLNSKEYKKKVVLEGLLERNHRISL